MNPKPLARAMQFVALNFALSWGIVGLSYIAGAEQSTIARFGVRLSIMFVPMGVAIILQKALYREAVLVPLGVSFQVNRWFAVGWLLPPVLAAATIAPALALPGVKLLYSPGHLLDQVRPLLTDDQYAKACEQLSALPFAALVVQSILAAIIPNSIAAFGEELGWRGFLHRALEPLGFWRSSLLIGAIWGLWHAPIILLGHNYPRHPVAGAFMMTVFCTLMGPLISHIRVRSGSVLAAAVMHGSLNATAVLPLMWVHGGSDLTTGMTGLSGLLVLFVTTVVLYFTRGHGSPPKTDSAPVA